MADFKFRNEDVVESPKGQGTVKTCSQQLAPKENKYHVQFGSDATKRDWFDESELKLISRRDTQTDPGFYPPRSITE